MRQSMEVYEYYSEIEGIISRVGSDTDAEALHSLMWDKLKLTAKFAVGLQDRAEGLCRKVATESTVSALPFLPPNDLVGGTPDAAYWIDRISAILNPDTSGGRCLQEIINLHQAHQRFYALLEGNILA